MSSKENNKRIAKNTLLLYFRMMLTMVVSLFTVRVVLNTLGVTDFGIYNVVGGIVVMFSFLSNTMSAASQRFFAYDLGQNNTTLLKRTFSLTMTTYVVISLIVLILAETIGLWFLNTQMVIPVDRIDAANWIYQFSILSFIATILVIPYNAVIIARENMSVYAYVSIIEVILKLAIVYLLLLFSYDKLKIYSVLMFITTLLISFIYFVISKRKYDECRFSFYWDKKLFITLISYSGWNMFGAVAGVLSNQGINILLNVFFGPIVNAARGIAYQISSAVNQFVMNFHTAVKPQITKYHAADQHLEMMSLVFKSSKYSYYLLFVLSMPVLLETNFLLTLWLKNVPEYVVLFTRLVIVNALIDSLSYSLQTAAQATGKIKLYQTVVGGMMLLNLPISYVLLKVGFQPQVTIYVSIGISIVCTHLRLFMLNRLIGLSIIDYVKKSLFPIVSVSFIAYILPLFFIFQLDETLLRFLSIGVISLLTSVAAIYFLGLSDGERFYILSFVKTKLTKSLNY